MGLAGRGGVLQRWRGWRWGEGLCVSVFVVFPFIFLFFEVFLKRWGRRWAKNRACGAKSLRMGRRRGRDASHRGHKGRRRSGCGRLGNAPAASPPLPPAPHIPALQPGGASRGPAKPFRSGAARGGQGGPEVPAEGGFGAVRCAQLGGCGGLRDPARALLMSAGCHRGLRRRMQEGLRPPFP